jgi:hypothetical protein
MFSNTKAGRVKWLVPSCAPMRFASTSEGVLMAKVGELQLEHRTAAWGQIICLFYSVSSWMMVGCDELERMWCFRWPILRQASIDLEEQENHMRARVGQPIVGGSEILTCVVANYEGEVLSTVPRASNIQVNTICVHFFMPYVSVNSCLVFINMI